MNQHIYTINYKCLPRHIITPVVIGSSAELAKRQGFEVRQKQVRALWDTGASDSSICKSLIKELGLYSYDTGFVQGLGLTQQSGVYFVDMQLPNNIGISLRRVFEFDSHPEFDCIIGLDIISMGDFFLSNYNKETVFSFGMPPQERLQK